MKNIKCYCNVCEQYFCDFDRPMLVVITDVILPRSMGETTQTPTHFVGFRQRCDVHHRPAGRHRRRCPDKMPMWLLNQAELPMILSSTCDCAELVALVQTIHAWEGGPRYFFLRGGGGLGWAWLREKCPSSHVYRVGPDCIGKHFSLSMHYVRNG